MTGEGAYRFSILVKRRKGSYTEEEFAAMSDLGKRYLNNAEYNAAAGTCGTAFVQLEDNDGNTRTFTFGASLCGAATACGSAIGGVASRATFSPELGTSLMLATHVIAGIVVEDEATQFYDDRIDYEITKKQYDAILYDLENNKRRVYNVLLYNCASFAVETARKAGLEIPRSFITTPDQLSRRIRGMAEKYKSTHAELAAADAAIGEMFDERKKPQERTEGHVVTLKERLASDPRLGRH